MTKVSHFVSSKATKSLILALTILLGSCCYQPALASLDLNVRGIWTPMNTGVYGKPSVTPRLAKNTPYSLGNSGKKPHHGYYGTSGGVLENFPRSSLVGKGAIPQSFKTRRRISGVNFIPPSYSSNMNDDGTNSPSLAFRGEWRYEGSIRPAKSLSYNQSTKKRSSKRTVVISGISPQMQEYVNSVTYAKMTGSTAKPRKWCGWWMRTQLGGGPSLNVAYNWRHYGRPSYPQIGAVVVWRHHVGMIVGRNSKGWIIRSGNDSNRVRERVRSLKGTIIRA